MESNRRPSAKQVTWAFLAGTVLLLALVAYAIYLALNLKPGHVLRINRADPELQAAIKQAQSGLGEFIKELDAPKQGESFAVKGAFSTVGGLDKSPFSEYLWVRRPRFKNGIFSGVLDQQPMAMPSKSKGDPVSFPKKDAVDWLIKDDNGIRGEYTDRVLDRRR